MRKNYGTALYKCHNYDHDYEQEIIAELADRLHF